MKTKHVFTTLAFSALLGLGALAGVKLGAKEVKKASATGPMNVYCKVTKDWWKADGAAVAAYCFKGETPKVAWPGERMEEVEADIWKFEVDPDDYPKIIFVRVNSSGNIADWGAKTADLTIPTDGKNLYEITSDSAVWGSPGVAGAWANEAYEEPAVPIEHTYSLIGTFSGWADEAMTVNDGVASATVDLQANAELKIRVDGAWATSYGYSNLDAQSKELFGEGENNNMVAGATGEYTFALTISTGSIHVDFQEEEIDYYVKVAAGEYTKMTYVKDFTYDETKTGKEYTATISGTEGQKVFFKANSTEIHPGASDDDLKNNLFYRNDNQQITIVQDATDETLTLRVYEDGYDSFLTGYVAAPRTIYFTNNKGWSGVPNYYAYDANGKEIAAWPGTAMTFVEYDQYSQPVYRFSLDATKFPTLVICDQAGEEKTVNILLASYLQDGFYLQDKAEGVYPFAQYTYAAVQRSIWVGGVEYALTETPEQDRPEDAHLLTQFETEAIDMKHNDQIRLEVDGNINDNCLQPYYSNNATYDGQYMRVVKEVVDKVYVKLMDDASTKIFVGGLSLTKQGYHVLVNGSEVVEMTHGEEFDGFDQYYSELVQFAKDDEIRFINANTEDAAPTVFDITTINAVGLGANFEVSAGHLKCKIDCDAKVYLKLKFEADEVYFGEVDEYMEEAKAFADNFKDDMESACKTANKQTAVETAWGEAAEAYALLSDEAKAELKKADSTVAEVRQFVERYIGIKQQHSDWDLDNFLNIEIPAGANYRLTSMINNNVMLIVVISAAATICGLALVLSLKKRKHQ